MAKQRSSDHGNSQPLILYAKSVIGGIVKATNFYFFFYEDERGKRVKSRWRMTMEEAPQWVKNPEPDLSSLEVRMLPESPSEYTDASHLAGPGPFTVSQPE